MMPDRISLRHLLSELPAHLAVTSAGADAWLGGIRIDSRTVQPGDLFVAMRGSRMDGHEFIAEAVARGAAAVVGELPVGPLPVPYARLADSRESLTWIAAAFYRWPGRKLRVIGVTGTDGKTTTTTLIHHILTAAGHRAGMVSTVSAVIGDATLDTGFHVTTPDAHDLQRFLAQMVDDGLTHAVLETTSHGWAQHRVDACEFDVGVITNITHEHLDEHGSYEAYRAAKGRLLEVLPTTAAKTSGNPRLAVINRDDGSYEYLNAIAGPRKVTYGEHADADVRATGIVVGAGGTGFVAEGRDFRVAIHSPLVGRFNVSNCLAALAATVEGVEIDPQVAASSLGSARPVPGRMEKIDLGQPFTAVVDFAHTPNALRVALAAARGSRREGNDAPGRVIAVFGSAGLRDREKRRLMAEVGADLADVSILTAEDPRTESLDAILAEMATGAQARGGRENETFWRIPDRGEAIRYAVRLARPGDVVMACGKGHEQSMCFGAREHLWDDRTAMRAALSELLGIAGPAMPYLPTQDTPESEWIRWK
jgi:UDP-N-acetylmuramoyl-L-alanyl-D-glutamate--2,6-diaminopimelate ligase